MRGTTIFFKDIINYEYDEDKTIKGVVLPISLNDLITHENKEFIVKKVDWDFDQDMLYITAFLFKKSSLD